MNRLLTIAVCLTLSLFVSVVETQAAVGVASMEYSSDGSKILVLGSASFVLDAESGKILYKIPTPRMYDLGTFSPDGSLIFARTAKGISVFDSSSGTELFSFYYLDYTIGMQSLSASPDGRYLLAGHFMGFGLLFDLQRSGEFVRKIEIGRAEIVSVEWNSGSTAAYFGTDNGQVHLVDISTGQKLASAVRLSGVQAMRAVRSHDRLLVVSNSIRYSRGTLYALDPVTLAEIEVVRLPHLIESASISGDRIATCLRRRKDVQIRKGAAKATRSVPLGYPCNPIGLSPDGKVVVDAVTVKRDVIIRAVDARTGRTHWSLRRSPLRP